jgi:hypothetical protein
MNRHAQIYTPPDELTADDLRAYRAGQLGGVARHRVERLLLENPLYADALDGLDALQQAGANLHTRDLHTALQERVQSLAEETAAPHRLMPLWIASAAASIGLVLSVALYYFFYVLPAANVPVDGIEPGTVLIDANALGTLATPKNEPNGVALVATKAPANVPAKAITVRRSRTRSKRPVTVGTSVLAEAQPIALLGEGGRGGNESAHQREDTDIMPLPVDKAELQRRRRVDTERAFLN